MTNNANAANRAITNGLNICKKWCCIEKVKCQKWNHFAKDCIEEKDTCGNCAENHRTNECTIATRKCHSCKSTDHASWSRTCPTYMKKTEDLNTRNPDNLLQFYPTSDSWTWTSNDRSHIHHEPLITFRPNCNIMANKPQHMSQQTDTYIPINRNKTDTYIPQYSNNNPTLESRNQQPETHTLTTTSGN